MRRRLIFIINHFRVFLLLNLSVGVILGTVLAGKIDISLQVSFLLVLLSFALVFTRGRNCLYAILMIASVLLGIARFVMFVEKNTIRNLHVGDEVFFEGVVLSIHSGTKNRNNIYANVKCLNVDEHSCVGNNKYRVLLSCVGNNNVGIDARISGKGMIESLLFNRMNFIGEESSYISNLQSKGVASIVSVESIGVIETESRHGYGKMLKEAKEYLENRTAVALKDRHSGVLNGVVYGNVGNYEETANALRRTGTTHIIAVSGYNISILLGYFGALGKIFNKKVYSLLCLSFIVMFVLFVGIDNVPVVRAGVMGIAYVISGMIGRKRSMLVMIPFIAFILLFINPFLYKSISFQLSFLSTIGLVFLGSELKNYLKFIPEFIREDTSSTLSAILFTLPVTLFNFREVSIIAPLSNILILPAVSYITVFGFVFIIVACVSLLLAKFIYIFLFLLIEYVFVVLDYLSKLDFAVIEISEGMSTVLSKVLIVVVVSVTIELYYRSYTNVGSNSN